MHGAAHHRRPHDRPPLQRTLQLVVREAVDASPEPVERREDVLRLQPTDRLERAHDRHAPALEQQLPREQRAVQLAQRQRPHDAAAKRSNRSARRSRSGCCARREGGVSSSSRHAATRTA